eukprot:GHVL01044119.1.p1 GENE.GHVL01044119.1~~GHVL01044119.1.p1  ORF type:complete len:244 (+),score=46.45 GHVL01044119.1:95-733(+)
MHIIWKNNEKRPFSVTDDSVTDNNNNNVTDDRCVTDDKSKNIPVFLVLNKVDKLEHPKWAFSRVEELEKHGNFDEKIYLSALTGRGVRNLIEKLMSVAKPGKWQYSKDLLTSLSKVEQVEQVVRTYIYCWFNKDLPYTIEHQTIGWTPKLDGTLIVEHELIVKDTVVARMISGVRGRLLFQMRRNVSFKLSDLWGQKVSVLIHVRALKKKTQ